MINTKKLTPGLLKSEVSNQEPFRNTFLIEIP